jgi:hypothetical protein
MDTLPGWGGGGGRKEKLLNLWHVFVSAVTCEAFQSYEMQIGKSSWHKQLNVRSLATAAPGG